MILFGLFKVQFYVHHYMWEASNLIEVWVQNTSDPEGPVE